MYSGRRWVGHAYNTTTNDSRQGLVKQLLKTREIFDRAL